MKPNPSQVVVRVPASTSNCGAGFDTLGLALSLYNRITVAFADGTSPIPDRPADGRAQEMVDEAPPPSPASTGRPAGGFRYRIDGEVPPRAASGRV